MLAVLAQNNLMGWFSSNFRTSDRYTMYIILIVVYSKQSQRSAWIQKKITVVVKKGMYGENVFRI